MAALQAEGQRRGDEVDEQEGPEVGQQLLKARRRGRLRVVVAIDKVVDDAAANMMSMNGETSGSNIWKMRMLGSAKRPWPCCAQSGAMFPDRLQGAEGPAEALAHEAAGVDGRLSISQGAVFVVDFPARFEQAHGEVGVFSHGVERVSAGCFYGRGAPCADGAGNHGDDMKEVKGAALEVLAGDVFQSLPAVQRLTRLPTLALPAMAPMPDLQSGNELGDGVGSDDGIGIDADVDLLGDALEGVVEAAALPSLGLVSTWRRPAEISWRSAGGHFSGAVAGAVVDHNDAQVFVVGVEHRANGANDNGFFVIRGNENGNARAKAGRSLAVRPPQAVDDGKDADNNKPRAHEHIANKENHKNKIANNIHRRKSDGVRKVRSAARR